MPDTSTPTHGRLGSVWRYGLAGLISVVAWGAVAIAMSEADVDHEPIIGWFLVGDLGLGLMSFLLVRHRHRWPAAVGVVTTLASFVSASSAGPAALTA